jgi:hypothetical protein
VTRYDVSGPVRLPVDLRWYRRYEELPQGEALVRTHCPARPIPTKQKARAQLYQSVAPVLWQAPALAQLPQQCRTKIDLGLALLAAAMQHKGPLRLLGCDSWSRAEELGARARSRHQAWISLLKKTGNLETNSCSLQDATGPAFPLAGPHIAVEALVPLRPHTASRAVPVGDPTYWTFPLAVRLPGLGTVRLVVSCRNAALTGTYGGAVRNRVAGHAQGILPLY